ncbi:MAG: NAD(P)H-dependent oxidoreductase subunit E [Actinobacteria bacterium]|nr:NAD(P)H-dependent oxidoreductase subunit E [Actinomycetota bacterium]
MVKRNNSNAYLNQQLAEIVNRYPQKESQLLPLLQDVQREFGYIDDPAIELIANHLNISQAEVFGVITFYNDFRREPGGDCRVRICRAEACQSMGAETLITHAKATLGLEFGETTSDGRISLDQVFCLGNCALAPTVMIDGRVIGRVDPERFDHLLARLSRQPSIPGNLRSRTPDGLDRYSSQLSASVSSKIAVLTELAIRSGSESSEPIEVFIPSDSAACSMGADEVATAIEKLASATGENVKIVRTGSRGMLWLEPLVEVMTEAGRIAYGPVAVSDVPTLLSSGFLEGARNHRLCLGSPDELPFLANQTRISFGRVGVNDPLSFEEFAAHGGLTGLTSALEMSQEDIVTEITKSGLRGRGGAGFPTGIKWKTVLDVSSQFKYVCCNADEGDSGTYADRMLMEGDPLLLIEGMVIAGIAVGAEKGFVYIRSEYPRAVSMMKSAVQVAYEAGLLGDSVLGSSFSFDLEIRVGSGSYVCGEETAMLESIEGRRGMVRTKPPVPAVQGLFGCPTVVNNVLSLAAVPWIIANGHEAYRDLGTERSSGTQVFQLSGNVRHGGIVEIPFGITLGELVEGYGNGTASGRPIGAVQIGGPLGAYLPPSKFDLPMDYESLVAAGGMLGHGGLVVFDDTVELGRMARFAMEFCAEESCGKCTPCRVGSVRGMEVLDRIGRGEDQEANFALLDDLCETMAEASLCAMGALTPMPIKSILRYFPESLHNGASRDGASRGDLG